MPRDLIKREYDEHPFAPYVRILGKGKRGSRSLSTEEARDAMGMILDGGVHDLQLGAFLMLLRVKEEVPDELQGFVEAVKSRLPGEALRYDIDWSSYAGKRRQVPWFLLALKALADSGRKIFIHGAEGHTVGRAYTRDFLKPLGIPEAHSFPAAQQALDQGGLVYMPLASLCPRLAEIIQMRSILGLRSPVHSLARLLNPGNASLVMQGIFHPPYAPLHQQAGRQLGYARTLVIKGEGGEIECNPDAQCKLFSSDETGEREELWPAYFKQRHPVAETLEAEALKAVWQGQSEPEYGIAAILGTLAITLKGLHPQWAQAQCLSEAELIWKARKQASIQE